MNYRSFTSSTSAAAGVPDMGVPLQPVAMASETAAAHSWYYPARRRRRSHSRPRPPLSVVYQWRRLQMPTKLAAPANRSRLKLGASTGALPAPQSGKTKRS